MRKRFAAILVLCVWLASPVVASAHEFWIEPSTYQVTVGEPIQGHLITGENFKGVRNLYLPHLFTSFEITNTAGTKPVTGIVGDIPPLNIIPAAGGLQSITYYSAAKTLDYTEWGKFESFLSGMGIEAPLARHIERGLNPDSFSESYIRCAKTIVAVGDASGMDRFSGMPLELVALTNPYTADISAGVSVQLFWNGKPLVDSQIKVFHRTGDTLQTAFVRTNTDGQAILPNLGIGSYLVNTVKLIELPPGSEAVWETYWASLTYELAD